MCTQPCVCDASVLAALGCLKNDACLGQAEAVVPKRFRRASGCNGLGPLPLWLFVLCQLGFIISFVRLILVPAVFFLAGVFRMLSNLMQCLSNCTSNGYPQLLLCLIC